MNHKKELLRGLWVVAGLGFRFRCRREGLCSKLSGLGFRVLGFRV